MDIEIKQKEIKIGGRQYTISEPTAKAMAKMARFIGLKTDDLKAKEIEEMAEVGIEVVVSMGVDQEMAEKLPLEALYSIAGAFKPEGK